MMTTMTTMILMEMNEHDPGHNPSSTQ